MKGSVALVLTGWTVGFITSGAAMAMPFSVLSDSVDYGEWKSGVRAAGFLTAIGAAFCLKAGSGLGGALPAWILNSFSYVPNAVQTPHALTGIKLSFVWLPAAAYALAALPVLFYHRYERLEPHIREQLTERRRLSAVLSSST
jgi:Na+/melibiose symporter-like transporter